MFLSMIVICAMSESFPPSDMNNYELFAYAVSGFSVALSLIMSIMYYVERSKKFVGGTIFELVGATILLGLWIGAAVIIQDPKNDIASTIDFSTGVEFVDEANLYFFTWFALFTNVLLVASFFRDVTTVNFRMLGWISVLATSMILLGVSRHLTDDICNADDGVMCFRIKYASVVSGAAGFIAFIASGLTYQSKMSSRSGLVLASPNAVLYPFSAALLTSSDGPGRTLGTLYFMIWIGSVISVLLLIGEFNGMFLDKEDMRETIASDSQQENEGGGVQTEDNTSSISVEKILESLNAESCELETGRGTVSFASPVASPVAKQIDTLDTEIRVPGIESSSDIEVNIFCNNRK